MIHGFGSLFLLTVVLCNVILALVFMRLSPTCFQYLEKEYSSIQQILYLALSVPLYWVIGALVFIFVCMAVAIAVVNTPSVLVEDQSVKFQAGYTFGVLFLFYIAFCLWGKLDLSRKRVIVVFLSFIVNPVLIQSIFLTMSV